jgi:hypothetical protein
MLRAAILENIKTRPDVFGSRQFYPLPGSSKPLPTLPSIVGNTQYDRFMPIDRTPVIRRPDIDTRAIVRRAVVQPLMTPGIQFLQEKLARVRDIKTEPVMPLSEPNNFNPSRQ